MRLLEFLSYLHGKGMINARKIRPDDDEGLENMLKVHRYAYMAKYFGLDLGYPHDTNLCGPYSPTMTKAIECLDLENIVPARAPPELREKDFLSVVSGRDPVWLEVATSIMIEKEFDSDITLEDFYYMRPDHAPETIRSVYADVHRLILPLAQLA